MIETGNLDTLGSDEPRGWFVGPAVSKESLLRSECCEAKWVRHPKGLRKTSGSGLPAAARTVVILLNGHWRFDFKSGRTAVLAKPGDYVAYGGDAPHENEAIEETHLLVLRWSEPAS